MDGGVSFSPLVPTGLPTVVLPTANAPVCDNAPVDLVSPVAIPLGLSGNGPVLTGGQTQLFAGPAANPNACGNDNQSPILPPFLIEQLLRPMPVAGRRDDRQPPPPQSAITLSDRGGVLEISNQYDTTFRNGRTSLQNIFGNLESAQQSQDAAEIVRLLEGSAGDLSTFRASSVAVRDVHTRYGLSDYSTTEAFLNLLFARYRAPVLSSSAAPSTQTARVEALMLGFNLAAINKADPTYRTGTAVKLLIEHQARALASEWGGEVQGLGIWGTNTVVAGVPESRAAEFRTEVQRRVLAFLQSDQALPESIARQMESPGIRTNDLPGRQTILDRPAILGLTGGHRVMSFDATHFQPTDPSFIRGQANIDIETFKAQLNECEMEARRLGRPVFAGAVPASSPIHGQGGRPSLATDALIHPGTAPHAVEPLAAPDPNARPSPLPTLEDIQAGRMPRPAHEAGHSIGQADRLTDLISQATTAAQSGNVAEAQRLVGLAMAYMNNPENRPPDQQPRSMLEFYENGYQVSLQQHRFPGVFRLELFPQIAERAFGGERFFIQMAEYRDYWGHNRTHGPDAGDSMHRLTMDILARGYEYHGVEVLTGTQGGDEVFFAIRGTTNDGHPLTDADIARISDYLGTNFNRIFQNVEHHEVTKVPLLPGGRFAGRNYLLQDGKLLVEQGAYTREQIPELLESVRIAYGQTISADNVTEVESLSKVGQVERLRLWSRVDAESGRVIEVFRPMGDTPDGFSEVRIPLSTTLTSAVEVPAGSGAEVVRLAMDRAGQQADEMKREGFDRPRAPGDPANSGPDPIVRIPLTERLNATRGGRLFLHGSMFAAGDLISEGALQVFTGRSNLGTLDFYANMVRGYTLMASGTYLGEGAARGIIAGIDNRLFVRQGNRMVLNQAAFSTEYSGLRSAGVHGAGILGAVLLSELATRGHLDPNELGWTFGSMGVAMGSSRLALYGVGAGMEMAGVATATRTALLRHPITAVAVIVGECLIMKGINRLREGWAREESEANLRENLASAMRNLDFTLARTTVVKADGTVDPEAQNHLQTAVRRVTDAFGDYMMFQFANETDEGRAFVSAQGEWASKESDLNSFLEDRPELREEIRQNPTQQLAILRRVRQQAEDFYAHNPFDTRSPYDSSLTHNRLATIIRARADLESTQNAFQEMVRRRLETAPNAPIAVPMHQSETGFRAGLRRDPLQIYQQFQGYLVARMAYADERRTRGVDATAIEAHYAPAPLAPPVNPMDFRLLLDPQPRPDPLNPFQFSLVAGNPGNTLSPFDNNPFLLPSPGNGITLTNTLDLNALLPLVTSPRVDDGSRPLYYLDASNHIRLMRADDQAVTGGVWVYNTETRHFEMVRDLPNVTGTGSPDLPVIDFSGVPVRNGNGPVASLNGRLITIDRTGPTPVVRFR